MEHSRRTIMHPDENLLTALAERTLAPAERGRVLEHLSDCAECRDVVFLAQQAAGEPTLQAALPFPVERRIPGAPRWRWAIVSAAGLLSAALIVAPVLLHRRAGNSARVYPTQMAASGQNTSQTQNGISPSTPSVQRPTESKATGVLRSHAESAPKPTLSPHSSKIADSAHAGPKNTLVAASASKALTSQTTPPSNVALAMNAEVAGSVTDPSGAAIPGAKVSLRLPGATALQTITGPSGNFAIPSVPPGNYTVEFNAMGFQTAVRDIDVHAQDHAALSETLALGSASESVNVSAGAAAVQLQTENSLVAERSVATQAANYR